MSNQTSQTSSISETEIPKIKLGLEEKYQEEEKEDKLKSIDSKEPLNPDNIGSDTVDQLPEPTGYRLLVLPFTPKNKTKGGILFSQETLDRARIATTCGYVLKMGPLCYKGEKFTSGPWCKKGDWVIFARYAGSRLPIEGGEVRILNDDEVIGTIKDPESVLHLI
jgi:co-chaperonin GroES (HSP10)